MLLRNWECLDSIVVQTVVNDAHSQLIQNIVESIDTVVIPRNPIIPVDLPFTYKCLQFPLKVDLTMTIKKPQGQTLQVAVLRLDNHCFLSGNLVRGVF